MVARHSLPDVSVQALKQSRFGAALEFDVSDIDSIIDCCERHAEVICNYLHDAGGLLVIRGLEGVRENPGSLVRLSRLFGPEVENYHETLTSKRFFHEQIPELLILSNEPPCSHPPPPKPTPRLTKTGELPVQFPHRQQWHTDQSYRRPPPDITLLYGVVTPPSDQGQTLFADCTAAYLELDQSTKQHIRNLQGIHAPSWVGRSKQAVLAGESPKPLLAHQLPQHQPLVRRHPITGKHCLYLCEEKQMDFVDGPIAGLETGPDGTGAWLLRDLLAHATQPHFTYIHEWHPGDLVINDNRCLLHCATWYDAERYTRLMWRATVMGNPGKEYEGETKSWISVDGYNPMYGMENV